MINETNSSHTVGLKRLKHGQVNIILAAKRYHEVLVLTYNGTDIIFQKLDRQGHICKWQRFYSYVHVVWPICKEEKVEIERRPLLSYNENLGFNGISIVIVKPRIFRNRAYGLSLILQLAIRFSVWKENCCAFVPVYVK